MNLLFIGDMHLRLENPRSRTDNVFEAQCKKLNEIFSLCKQHKALPVCTGDIFDRPQPAYKLVTEFMSILNYHQTGFLAVGGNHDFQGRSVDSIDRTAFGLLLESRLLQRLSSEATVLGGGAYLYGASYGEKIPTPRSPAEFNILVCHEMALPGTIQVPFESVPAETLAGGLGYHLIVVGHYHYPFSLLRPDNSVMFNPGAMTRLTIDDGDIALQPTVVLLVEETKQLVTIPLSSARPSSEVLDLTGKVEAGVSKEHITQFVTYLNAQRGDTIIDPVSLLRKAMKDLGTSAEVCAVVEEALEVGSV